MTIALSSRSAEVLFERDLERDQRFLKISGANITELNDVFLSVEANYDSYAISSAYYAITGRRGLWVYSWEGAHIPICWHPNALGTLLVFPPCGSNGLESLQGLLSNIPSPPCGLLLARVDPIYAERLKNIEAAEGRWSFEAVEENVLDWNYPARIISTSECAEMAGHAFMHVRNRVRQTHKYSVLTEDLDVHHISAIEGLAARWARTQSANQDEISELVSPYVATLQLFEDGRHALRGLVFSADGQMEAVSIWDIPAAQPTIANLYVNLCNTGRPGLSEFLIQETCARLRSRGIAALNLGGSETASLDKFKAKFMPIKSVPMCSVEPTWNGSIVGLFREQAYEDRMSV